MHGLQRKNIKFMAWLMQGDMDKKTRRSLFSGCTLGLTFILWKIGTYQKIRANFTTCADAVTVVCLFEHFASTFQILTISTSIIKHKQCNKELSQNRFVINFSVVYIFSHPQDSYKQAVLQEFISTDMLTIF